MAMSGHGRRRAENAIANCQPFQNSTGSLTGTRGSTRTLGWLESHAEARRIRELLSQAVYVVWSYGTPIGWVSEDEDGERTAYYVDEVHSTTTSHHQTIARMGLSEYETIGERRPARRRAPRPVVQEALDRTNALAAGYARVAAMEVGEVRAQMRYRTVANEQMLEEIYADDRASLYEPVRETDDSPGYQNGLTEDHQQATLRRLLDPRYANPDWVPGRDFEADRQAELRDIQRIEDEMRERGWRL